MSPEWTPYVVVAWVVAVLAAFPSWPPHRAVLAAVLSGTLFLPEVGRGVVELGPVKLSKYNAISYACLLGAVLYDSGRLFGGRVRWFDLPMLVWCVWPVPSVLLNDPPPDGSPPLRDALSQTLAAAVTWGVPYVLGRVYFGTGEALRDLALGLVLAAAVYTPLCLWEARMSPQLHATVYGYAQHQFAQTIRFDGFRPMVFMPHGLWVGLYMCTGSLLAVWLRRPLRLTAWALALVPVAVVVKSTGALALAVVGGAVLWLGAATGWRGWLLVLAAAPPAYVAARTTGLWTGAEAVETAAEYVGADRSESLAFRLANENILIRRALERPFAGWGGWGRARVYDETGKDISVTDGLWVIALGDRGLVGLSAFGLAVLLPVVRFGLRSDPRRWGTPEVAPAAGCAVVLALWAINNLPNAMSDPFALLVAGGLAGYAVSPPAGGPRNTRT